MDETPTQPDAPSSIDRRALLVKGGVVAAAVAGAGVLAASPASADPTVPVLLPISPQRIYDSRNPGQGRLSSGQTRILVGGPAGPDLAYLMNVTVTATIGAGWLSLFPGGQAYQGTSTVNWSGPEQTVANNAYTGIRQADSAITVRAAGGGSAHFVIDLIGVLSILDLASLQTSALGAGSEPSRALQGLPD